MTISAQDFELKNGRYKIRVCAANSYITPARARQIATELNRAAATCEYKERMTCDAICSQFDDDHNPKCPYAAGKEHKEK